MELLRVPGEGRRGAVGEREKKRRMLEAEEKEEKKKKTDAASALKSDEMGAPVSLFTPV